MATNATTWFYQEPEHRAYYLEERVNQTFWSNRIHSVYLDCVQETPPFRMVGEWEGAPLAIEWVPQQYFILTTTADRDLDALLKGLREVLGFAPTVSYVDPGGQRRVEWYVQQPDERIREIQGNPNYRQITRYTA